MLKKAIILTLFGLMPGLTMAEDATTHVLGPLKLPENEQGGDVSIEKEAWVNKMQKTLPGVLCTHDQYFEKCFNITHQECTNFTQLLVQACLNNAKLALPQTLTAQQGQYWGQMIGRCSFDLYDKFMKPKKRDTKECRAVAPSDLPKPSQALP